MATNYIGAGVAGGLGALAVIILLPVGCFLYVRDDFKATMDAGRVERAAEKVTADAAAKDVENEIILTGCAAALEQAVRRRVVESGTTIDRGSSARGGDVRWCQTSPGRKYRIVYRFTCPAETAQCAKLTSVWRNADDRALLKPP
ncbi:MAG: hypothetical protein JO256_09150 [Alphaproteobacteria bacterium]|nr:hypothetical protein [Alphaproteobacteria bacterium]